MAETVIDELHRRGVFAPDQASSPNGQYRE
jgi:hypothetical protein